MSDQAMLLLRKQLKGACVRACARRAHTPARESPPCFCARGAPAGLTGPLLPRHAELSKNPVDGFSAGLVDDSNVFEWQITIMGPPDTI